jgi:hypothetical protein
MSEQLRVIRHELCQSDMLLKPEMKEEIKLIKTKIRPSFIRRNTTLGTTLK